MLNEAQALKAVGWCWMVYFMEVVGVTRAEENVFVFPRSKVKI